jgi:hypothetical protein
MTSGESVTSKNISIYVELFATSKAVIFNTYKFSV